MTTGAVPSPSAHDLEQWLCGRLEDALDLPPDTVDPCAPLAGYGLDSARVALITGEIEELLGRPVKPSLVYEHATLREIVCALETTRTRTPPESSTAHAEPIAVVGLACRFPGGADTPARLWELIRRGGFVVGSGPDDRPYGRGRAFLPPVALLDGIEEFDAALFEIPPAEARRIDPQQRLLLEVAWEALEDAAILPQDVPGGRVGIFVGLMQTHDYLRLQERQLGGAHLDDPHLGLGASASAAAGRVSHAFDLRGPSIAIDTACSSSLVAVQLACDALARGDCDVALAGGVHVLILADGPRSAAAMGLLSHDGRTRAFAADADGFGLGEGCGLVALRRLRDAEPDHTVLATIRGGAVNQDGRTNGLAAPNGRAQVEVIAGALARAGIAADTIDYVEAHGGASPVGDSVELGAIARAFDCAARDRDLVVGSVKTNLGHLVGAAGIAGLIKTVLALRHGEIPLHVSEGSLTSPAGVSIPRHTIAWPRHDRPRRAGVSAFGWSGTNAHLIVEEHPRRPAAPSPQPAQPLLVSAASEHALRLACSRLAAHLEGSDRTELADVAFTLAVGRRALRYRRVVVARTTAEAAWLLRDPDAGFVGRADQGQRPVVAVRPPPDALSIEVLRRALVVEVGDPQSALLASLGRLGVRAAGSIDDPRALMVELRVGPADERTHVAFSSASDGRSVHERLLRCAAEIWVRGGTVDWREAWRGELRRRIQLPTYAFDRKRHWVDAGCTAEPDDDAPLPREEWLSAVGWHRLPPGIPGDPLATMLLHDAGDDAAAAVADALRRRGIDVHPRCTLDDDTLRRVDRVVDLRRAHARAADPATAAARRFDEVVDLAQTILRVAGRCRLLLVTGETWDIGGETPNPAGATALGPCRVLPLEADTVTCRLIDWARDETADRLAAEIAVATDEPLVALRGGHRWAPDLQPLADPHAADVLRERGVYLVTGGLGGLGSAVAERLVVRVGARLVLVGRRGLAGVGAGEVVRRLEELGGEVLVVEADVGVEGEVRAAVAAAVERFGALHGVVHAAGVPGGRLLAFADRGDSHAVLAPKVRGTANLGRALEDVPLDFLVLFSSISSLTGGGAGQAAYAAANAFIDAYAISRNRSRRTVAIDWAEWEWDAWTTSRPTVETAEFAAAEATRRRFGITFDDGFELMCAAIASGVPHVVASPRTIASAVQDARTRSVHAVLGHTSPTRTPSHAPDPTRADPIALERYIAGVFADTLGHAHVPPDANFFDLGGNSLLGLALMATLRAAFPGAALPPHVLFAAPSPCALAAHLTAGPSNGAIESRRDRGRLRRETVRAAGGRTARHGDRA